MKPQEQYYGMPPPAQQPPPPVHNPHVASQAPQAYMQYGYQPQPMVMPYQQPPPPSSSSHPQQAQATNQGVDGFFSSVATNFGPIGNTFTFIQGSQSYVQQVQQKMGFLSMTGFNYYFAISKESVRTKLMMILTPFLKQWNFSRIPEQIPGGPKYRPPRSDPNCPDLYIPLMAFFTFIILACMPRMLIGGFTPEVLYTKAYRGLVGWGLNTLLLKAIVFAMSLPSSLSFLEALCYSGYLYVLLCINATALISRVSYAGVATWVYSSLCMAIFLVKSFKSLIHHEARHYGGDPSRYNYLLLAMAVAQVPIVYFLGP